MEKKCSFPIGLFIISLVSFSLFNCISYKAVQLKEIKSVEVMNNDISSGKITVNLRVINPNNYPIKFKKYDLHAFLNNTDIGQIEAGKKIVLKKNSDAEYKVTFSPDVSKVMSLAPSLLFQGSGNVALKGSMKIKAMFLSRKFAVDLNKKVSASDFR